VYVLGAGASRAIRPCAPLMKDLLPEALKILKRPGTNSAVSRIERVAAFVNDFFLDRLPDAPLAPDESPRLEDILSQLDLAIEEDRPLTGKYDIGSLRTIREDVVFAICGALRDRLDWHSDNEKEQAVRRRGDELLSKFLGRITPEDSIVSLNYDLVVDNALANKAAAEAGGVNYGIHVRFAQVKNSGDWRTVPYELPSQSAPVLYKLHGSLNWVYCPSCQQLDVTVRAKGALYVLEAARNFSCKECGTRYSPFVIAPTLLKTYHNSLLAQIWRHTEERISKADDIVFVGYSMPDADVQLRGMLTRAVFANRQRRSKTEGVHGLQIRVIGNSPPGCDTHKRYTRFFGAVAYEGAGFEGHICPESTDCNGHLGSARMPARSVDSVGREG
jgi:SIR2-like domain